MNTKLLSNLQVLGIPANEAKVYLALIQLKQSSAGEIIKTTNLHRSVVYESLDRLTDKKLISKTIKQNIAHFKPTNPEHIQKRIKVQQALADQTIPELNNLLGGHSPEINVYEGVESYRRFWLESVQTLPKGSTDYIAGAILGKWRKYMGDDLGLYMKTMAERKIIWQIIVFNKDEIDLTLKKQFPDLHIYRLLSRRFTKQGNFNIFGDDTVILHSVTEPMIIEIKSKTMVKVFRDIFDILWDMGEEI